ncbi:MAG TPA: N-acetyltransferase [Anaerovoracaceae bacterium]|nr:N-acetyltransferase [Anaerovoracaceae bacterium]
MLIRKETPADYEIIRDLVKEAFKTAEFTDGEEHVFVDYRRRSGKYINDLSLVAEEKNKIVGYIMISETHVECEGNNYLMLYLFPLVVNKDFRKENIGSRLVKYSLNKAKDMKYKAVFLAGNENYYNRFGFVATCDHDIESNIKVDEEFKKNIMVYELYPNALKGITGTVIYKD